MKPRRSRRVEPLKDSDYDHEINLLDHSSSVPRKPSTEAEGPRTSTSGPSVEAEPSSPERRPTTPEPPTAAADHANGSPSAGGDDHTRDHAVVPALEVEGPTPLDESAPRPTPSKRASKQPPRHRTPKSAIDILYENQRGGFLCGIPLFASKALGNLDPPPWTNFAHKPSPTDITTAQPPDPSWEWAWPEWKVNHDEDADADEEGWEYSFAFHRRFSWHGPKWWNSFVRRRVWIRKRVKKDSGYVQEDPGMLNAQYFAVRPASASVGSASVAKSQNGDIEDVEQPDIEDVASLLRAMRASRIDREKIEAIDNYLEHAADDFARLEREMHEIMSLFVFQASRRLLLTRMAHIYDQTTKLIEGGDSSEKLKEKSKNLTAAIRHADEEVRRLEYWSDIKEMVVEGETKGAMDHCEGWDERWQGLDSSGPTEPAAPEEGPK
ncbi:hypothetical protein GE09DRAFT_1121495 [Coniochaeta sp. 2T2.1]|nr:hypothetical protein GE09DRAFT_1121495 [Coniochaeta sp. 2T2.1]